MLIKTMNVATGELVEREMTPEEIAALPPPPPLDAERVKRVVSEHIESVARSMGYSSAVSCASYVASTNPEWAAQAQAFIAWRDAVWQEVFARRDEAPPATAADVVAMLPEWVPPQ
jgi:hypothetical protein